jgi:hypothetical protein
MQISGGTMPCSRTVMVTQTRRQQQTCHLHLVHHHRLGMRAQEQPMCAAPLAISPQIMKLRR